MFMSTTGRVTRCDSCYLWAIPEDHVTLVCRGLKLFNLSINVLWVVFESEYFLGYNQSGLALCSWCQNNITRWVQYCSYNAIDCYNVRLSLHFVIVKVFYPLLLIVSYEVGIHFHPRLYDRMSETLGNIFAIIALNSYALQRSVIHSFSVSTCHLDLVFTDFPRLQLYISTQLGNPFTTSRNIHEKWIFIHGP